MIRIRTTIKTVLDIMAQCYHVRVPAFNIEVYPARFQEEVSPVSHDIVQEGVFYPYDRQKAVRIGYLFKSFVGTIPFLEEDIFIFHFPSLYARITEQEYFSHFSPLLEIVRNLEKQGELTINPSNKEQFDDKGVTLPVLPSE